MGIEDEEMICMYDCGALTTVDVEVSSISPESVLDRVLNHYRELELSGDQIREILNLRRQYVRDYIEVMVEFSSTTLEIEKLIHRERPSKADDKIDSVLAQRAAIFVSHERLFVEAVDRAKQILSSKQKTTLLGIYTDEREAKFGGMHQLISSSFAPIYETRKVER